MRSLTMEQAEQEYGMAAAPQLLRRAPQVETVAGNISESEALDMLYQTVFGQEEDENDY